MGDWDFVIDDRKIKGKKPKQQAAKLSSDWDFVIDDAATGYEPGFEPGYRKEGVERANELLARWEKRGESNLTSDRQDIQDKGKSEGGTISPTPLLEKGGKSKPLATPLSPFVKGGIKGGLLSIIFFRRSTPTAIQMQPLQD